MNQAVQQREGEHEREQASENGRRAAADAQQRQQRTVASLRVLWERRRWLGRVSLWALLSSTLLAFLIPTRYESTTRLMPPEPNGESGLALLAAASGGRAGDLASFATDALAGTTSGILVGVLGSITIQDALIDQFDLKNVYSEKRIEDTRAELVAATNIVENRKTGIITITVSDKNPERATEMAAAYVRELGRIVVRVSTSAARRERIFLEGRLEVVQKEWQAAAKDFSEFSSSNSTIDIREQGRAMVEAAAALQAQVIVIETELRGLRQIYTEQNPRVRVAEARAQELRKQLVNLGGSTEADNGMGYPTIRKLPILGVPYAEHYRRTKIAEKVIEFLTQRYEQAKAQEAKDIPSVSILDPPTVPEKPAWPPRGLLIVFGTLLTLAAAVVWLVIGNQWNQERDPDPAKAFVLEVLTTLRESAPWNGRNGKNQKPAPDTAEAIATDVSTSSPRSVSGVGGIHSD